MHGRLHLHQWFLSLAHTPFAQISQVSGIPFNVEGVCAKDRSITNTMSGQFELSKKSSGFYLFNFLDSDGQVILMSQLYQNKLGAEAGIALVKAHIAQKTDIECRISSQGSGYFVLKTSNNEILGRSNVYGSMPALSKAFELLQDLALGAPIVDLTNTNNKEKR